MRRPARESTPGRDIRITIRRDETETSGEVKKKRKKKNQRANKESIKRYKYVKREITKHTYTHTEFDRVYARGLCNSTYKRRKRSTISITTSRHV